MNEKNGARKRRRGGSAVEERRCMTNMLINFVVRAGFAGIQEVVCVTVVQKAARDPNPCRYEEN
jgi:hypothetical protein